MYVVQITPELAPVAKVGGLGDVIFGLSRELEWRGNTVETILPKYDCMRYDQIWGLAPCFNDLWVLGTMGISTARSIVAPCMAEIVTSSSRTRVTTFSIVAATTETTTTSCATRSFRVQPWSSCTNRQASGDHPLPRLANRPYTSLSLRDLPALRHGKFACMLHGAQFPPSRGDR